MNQGMKLGFSWTELLSLPLYVLNNQISAANDADEALAEQSPQGDGGVRDANQEDIKHFI